MDRRKFLKVAGAAGAAGLSAGCLGQFGSQPYNDGTMQFLMSPTEPQDQMRAQYTPVQERLNSHIDDVDEVTIDLDSILLDRLRPVLDLVLTPPTAAVEGER